MKRPFASKRPIGPLAQTSDSELSEFDQIEVQRNSSGEEHAYTVAGIFNPGGADETVGLVMETNTLVVNGDNSFAIDADSVAIDGSGARVVFTAPEDGTVAIKERSSDLVNIVVE